MKTSLIVGVVLGTVFGLTANLLGDDLNIWLAIGAGVVTGSIWGFLKRP